VSEARLRPRAETDLVQRTRHHRSEGGEALGLRFFEAAVSTLRTIERRPGLGSLRLGELCNVPGLRSHRVDGFPCGWFYFERSDHVDVVRLLSDAQDLPRLLAHAGED
jgi:toxin ParE1/3/4